jgi:predicted dehydrogenase
VRGWHDIHVTDGSHPYMSQWWVPGLQIGYEHTFIHQLADFLAALEKGEPMSPDFREALETQKVCEAILKSAQTGSWEKTGARSFEKATASA